jgi:prevent-host-death family protein
MATTVGARELKLRLGSYLRRVRDGATLIVTERGAPVAELRPIDPVTLALDDQLGQLVSAGVLAHEVREGAPLLPFEPIVNRGRPASEAVIEDREDRF